MTATKPSRRLVGGVSAAALAAAAVLSTPLISKWEGRRLDPYRDLVGIWTVCDGETRVVMRRYAPAECEAMLARAIETDFGPAIAACVPGLATRPEVFAASVSLAYNIGSSAFCKSTIARRFNAGDWRGGCDGFAAWVMAGGKRVQGLVNRRRDEANLCRQGQRA